MLKETSVVLEMLRDNTFINIEGRTLDGRSGGTTMLPPLERFLRVCDFVEEIGRAEKSVLETVRNAKSWEVFEDRFGQVLIARRCLLGLEKSIKRYFFDRDKRRVRIPRLLASRIQELRYCLRGLGVMP
jgi:hypothetical protein